MRTSGVLLPVSALPGPYGIGCFSKEAYKFVDTLVSAGISLWQVLPLGPVGYGDSPYQPFSAFAGNSNYIDLETLVQEGLLTQKECDRKNFGTDPERVDYARVNKGRISLLKTAFSRAKKKGLMQTEDYQHFLAEESSWLEEYALYMALKDHFGGVSWDQWDKDIRNRETAAMERYRQQLREEIDGYEFQQYLFFEQWWKLKEYANKKGVRIIGDIPIYVAYDSADTWANPELFQLDEDRKPVAVSGCPPDAFSVTGQLWGNPLYDWPYHKSTDYAWWVARIAHCFRLYDMLRIDHFRGFDTYYAVPYGEKTAQNGSWQPGPGMDLFTAIKEQLGDLPIIAEDLGFLTDTVKQLLKDSGYPGMKVLQFAFDSREQSDYLPHYYERNCVVYTGTHDNDTLKGWWQVLAPEDEQMALDYMNNAHTPEEEIHWDFICLALRSVADTCIIPAWDYLGLGTEARFNVPSTVGGNWEWRMKAGAFNRKLVAKIRRLNGITARK